MKISDILHYCKLHAKTIGILAVIGLVFILVIISRGKSAQIQQLLLKLKQIKVTNDVAVIQHTININNQSISGLDASNEQAKATIAAVNTANTSAQAKIADKQTTIDQLAAAYNALNN